MNTNAYPDSFGSAPTYHPAIPLHLPFHRGSCSRVIFLGVERVVVRDINTPRLRLGRHTRGLVVSRAMVLGFDCLHD